MIPVVLSGGSGTRLWPISRSKVPKQFSDLFHESLQTMALKRALRLGSPWILTTSDLKDHTEKHLLHLKKSLSTTSLEVQTLYEPMARNTAPALAYLCWVLRSKGMGQKVVAVFPSDQLIEDEAAFEKCLKMAELEAQKNFIVTLGIHPTFPATGYGYIETRKESDQKVASVIKFYEKPSLQKAQDFLSDGHFYWNAGMFVFKPDILFKLLNTHSPELMQKLEGLKPDQSNLNEVYSQLQKISIDYAVMEKLGPDQLKCIPCDMGWNDVGSWDSIADIFSKKPSDHQIIESQGKNNFVHSKAKKVYAFAGVEDLILVDTPDAILITKKGHTQGVKEVVDKLNDLQHRSAAYPLNEERPWGSFEVLKDTDKFKSKVITVDPGGQISYQSHNQREEHWMVVCGSGEVILNDQVIPVSAGTYVKIPLKAKHRIRNTGKVNLLFVEVQLGTYFGEDDIVRYQDDYKRV